jgi:hypothetical protein
MAYPTDGSSHAGGVKNEKELRMRLIDDRPLAEAFVPHLKDGADYEVNQLGGTKEKADLELVTKTATKRLSLKKKEGINTGSFDWINSTVPCSCDPRFAGLCELCKSFQRGKQPNKEELAEARRIVTAALVEKRRLLTSDDIISILHTHVVKAYETIDLIMINDVVNHNLYGFSPNALPFFKYMCGLHREAFIRENGKKSGAVIFKDWAGREFDFGIRLRFETNNGIRAMFGGRPKGKNNSSSPTIKIQQDNVRGLLESINENDLTTWSYKG